MNLFWIHGGPGYNSHPEELLLGEELREIFEHVSFWNHPSKLRGDETNNTWSDYTNHLEKCFVDFTDEFGPTLLVCSSFGAMTSLPILEKHSKLVKGVIWLSGTTDKLNVLGNIFKLIREDYLEHGNENKANLITPTLEQSNLSINSYMSNLAPVLENTNLANYYWTNKLMMNQFYVLMLDEWAFDFDCFFGVVSTLPEMSLNSKHIMPALLCYGENEVIINNTHEERRAKSLFTNTTTVIFKESSHFPHLEEKSLFLRSLKEFARLSYDQTKQASIS